MPRLFTTETTIEMKKQPLALTVLIIYIIFLVYDIEKNQPINLVECILIGIFTAWVYTQFQIMPFLRSGVFKGYFFQLPRVRILREAGLLKLTYCHLKDPLFRFRRYTPFIYYIKKW